MARWLGKIISGGSYRPDTSHPRHASEHENWWTPDRDAKLLYVVITYPFDFQKAALLLGCPLWVVRRRYRKLEHDAGNTDVA
jgi:hypothetical protein